MYNSCCIGDVVEVGHRPSVFYQLGHILEKVVNPSFIRCSAYASVSVKDIKSKRGKN